MARAQALSSSSSRLAAGLATYHFKEYVPRAWRVRVYDPRIDIFGRPLAWEHNAPIVDGLVYDLTARQFDPTLPVPWVVPLATWKRAVRRWLGPGTPLRTTVHDDRGYPVSQAAVRAALPSEASA